MLKILWITIISFCSFLVNGQTEKRNEFLNNISLTLCDSLKSVENRQTLTPFGAFEMMKTVLTANQFAWDMELNHYLKSSDDPGLFYEYFTHLQLQNCPVFRKTYEEIDEYLKEEKTHGLYKLTKNMLFSLEDGIPFEKVTTQFNHPEESLEIWNKILKLLPEMMQISTLDITQYYDSTYLFSCRFFDYINAEPNFQIDIRFKEQNASKIESIDYLSKVKLMREIREIEAFERMLEEKSDSTQIKD